jgi:hypothetical protein
MSNHFLNGAIMMGFTIVGLFFLRFHRSTRERLFAMFAAAFFVLGIERVALVSFDLATEFQPYIYLIRLLAFLLIIIAIVDKNRGTRAKP